MVDALVLSPYSDLATSRSSLAARIAEHMLQEHNIEVSVLDREDCTRAKFERLLREKREKGITFDLILYAGHGLKDSWTGQGDKELEPLLDLKNVGLLSGSVVVGITCLSASILLKSGIGKTVRGAIGFNDILYLPEEVVGGRNYTADFIRTFLVLPLSLAKGYQISQTVEEYKELCSEYVQFYGTEKLEFGEDAANWMRHNSASCEFLGNPNVKIGAEVVL